MKSLLFCCLLGIFLATGMCMECEVCVMPGETCKGTMMTCKDNEDTCVMFQTELIRAPLSFTFTSKMCSTSDTCHLDYVETNLPHELAVRSKRACCVGDECDTMPPVVLEHHDNRYNGLHCPGCIGLASTECNEKLVSCWDTENQCLSITGKNLYFLVNDISIKGCATESLCTLLQKKIFSPIAEWELDVKCTPAFPQASQ
uniref:Phospholipase A2 inhibitor n=1 Tax=Protobothrops elegans TaxID=88086 RepID=D9N4B8_PROEL|nr:phospholipase A2 inhibitor [Protobothrops elegans]